MLWTIKVLDFENSSRYEQFFLTGTARGFKEYYTVSNCAACGGRLSVYGRRRYDIFTEDSYDHEVCYQCRRGLRGTPQGS